MVRIVIIPICSRFVRAAGQACLDQMAQGWENSSIHSALGPDRPQA
jgi:hypothetical protein